MEQRFDFGEIIYDNYNVYDELLEYLKYLLSRIGKSESSLDNYVSSLDDYVRSNFQDLYCQLVDSVMQHPKYSATTGEHIYQMVKGLFDNKIISEEAANEALMHHAVLAAGIKEKVKTAIQHEIEEKGIELEDLEKALGVEIAAQYVELFSRGRS